MSYQTDVRKDIIDLVRNHTYFTAFEKLDVVVENFIQKIECDGSDEVSHYLNQHSNQEIADRIREKYDIGEYPDEVILEALEDFRVNTLGGD